jgi:uncharacterized protein YigE (DUF2233 family)
LILPAAILVASCSPQAPVAPPPPADRPLPPVAAISPAPTAGPAAAMPSEARAPARVPRVVRTTLGGIPLTAVAFDSRTHRLVVADQAGGPGSQWPDARAAGASRQGLAAVNGGFFTPEGKPLGLVIAGGRREGSLNRASSLGAGLFLDDGTPRLVRREGGAGGGELLQAGPFLVENGRAVGGLSPANSTARTFVGWDGGTGWFIARSGACSLADLAQALAGAKPGGVAARQVLNLDGGRSSDLWASASIPGGPLHERPFWNKPVRNFLVLRPR